MNKYFAAIFKFVRANASSIGKLVLAALIVSPYIYVSFSKDAREARAVFRDIAQQRIVHIIVEPGRYHSLVNAPIVVSDKQVIAAFAKALSKLPTHFPNHPEVTKSVVLRIQLEDKVIGGELVASSNNGITFYYVTLRSTHIPQTATTCQPMPTA